MSLREIMTEQIKHYGYLDFDFTPIKSPDKKQIGREGWIKLAEDNLAKYLAYLAEKDEEDFLAIYNRVREAINALD